MRAITTAPGEGLLERLAHVSENDNLPIRMRCDSLKLLAGGLFGRIRLSPTAKLHLSEHFDLTPKG